MSSVVALMTVCEDDPVSSTSLVGHLPHALAELYIATEGRGFVVERVVFRRADDVDVTDELVVIFADERLSTHATRQWMYHRVDGLVTSTLDECMTVEAFLRTLAHRELHQRAEDDRRYREKCVDGRYVASPDLRDDVTDDP